ncbi:hypothetical protein QAD02_022418 [Eretmocerus hayati]|uniref:Uncharacterized protein n=1 Tax=Eretmocerus hayati TaxID=131215 RepID=A0ACC2PTI4_9HYME|nr:hypothetical protein QAD02_022418 [Eretmocerus hayati]
MALIRLVLICLLVSAICGGAFSRHLRHHNVAPSLRATLSDSEPAEDSPTPKNRRSLRSGSYASNDSGVDPTDRLPYSYKRLDKMMKKAILQIIMGELRPADMLLLKALNYTPEEVMEIREQELERIRLEQQVQQAQPEPQSSTSATGPDETDSSVGYDAYNRQAVYDYENGDPAPSASSSSIGSEDSLRQAIDKAMEPHVVFRVRYDDSELDSRSEERLKLALGSRRANFEMRHSTSGAVSKSGEDSFHDRNIDDRIVDTDTAAGTISENVRKQPSEPDYMTSERGLVSTGTEATHQGISEYEGLEWLGGDVYRVKPEAMEAILAYEDATAGEGDDEPRQEGENMEALFNDTGEYQSDAESPQTDFFGDATNGTDNTNLTAYERLAIAQRKDQGQKAMEDIKLRVLAMTGRFNLTASNNQVQREKLTMFYPTCRMPRNTDSDAWSDPFSMNMHFQFNVTSGEHVLAAKLRLFKLPQDISTSPSSRTYEGEDEDEKKIRVSVYLYTKSLKKHRAKKRLMDSIVTPLTSQGAHLAMDVRQALRTWRPSSGSGSNHGLVVQVEDQDGKPLKPAQYIQEPSCQLDSSGSTQSPDESPDQKAYYFGPAIYIRTCSRYVRLVDGKIEMYVQCKPSQRH